MIKIKTDKEIEVLRRGGRILAQVLGEVAGLVRSGISTMDLENFALEQIASAGAKSAFKHYQPHEHMAPYPAALCTSVNDQIVHAAPSDSVILNNGDIISIDIGIEYEGMFTDSSLTVPVGQISPHVQKLLDGTKKALSVGIAQARQGKTLGDVAHAIEQVGREYKLGVVRDLVGHGVGHAIHEPPNVPNYGRPGTLEKIKAGMVIAIEPMFTLGDWHIEFAEDGWTVITSDGSWAAHFEHTVAITERGPLVLTRI